MKVINNIVLAIAIIGCVNWGLIGLFEFDLVAAIFGTMSMLSRLIYVVVGLCGLYAISFFSKVSHE